VVVRRIPARRSFTSTDDLVAKIDAYLA